MYLAQDSNDALLEDIFTFVNIINKISYLLWQPDQVWYYLTWNSLQAQISIFEQLK